MILCKKFGFWASILILLISLNDSESESEKSYRQTGEMELIVQTGHSSWVRSISFHPEGRLLASGSGDDTIKLWDVSTGKELRTLQGHTNSVGSVVFSPDGQLLASGSWDGTIKLWDVSSGEEPRTLQEHTNDVPCVAFSPDGLLLASGSWDGTIKLWDVSTVEELRTLQGHIRSVASVTYSLEGKLLASGGGDSTITICDLANTVEIYRTQGLFEISHKLSLLEILFNAPSISEMSDTLSTSQLKSNRLAITYPTFSPDGRLLAGGCSEGAIKLWDVSSGEELQTLQGHTNEIQSVTFSSDSRLLASGSEDGAIKLWDVSMGKELQTLQGHTSQIQSVAFSPDGRLLASGSLDNTIKLWDVSTVKELQTLQGHTSPIESVAFSPDGRLLASGSWDNTIRLWDVSTGKELRTLQEHARPIVAFSPDGRLLASGSEDQTIKIWEVANGTKLCTLRGHNHLITSLVFSPDGKLLVSGSRDGKIKFWNTLDYSERFTLVFLNESDWAIVTPRGHFDASPNGMKLMHWVVGLEPIDLEQLKERYYEPGLLQKVLGYDPEPLRDVEAFTHVDLYPEIDLDAPDPDDPSLGISLTNRGGGIGRVTVLINGKEIHADARGPSPDPDASQLTLDVDLSDHPYLIPGQENTITVKAYNAEGYLASRGATLVYTPPGKTIAEKPHLWAIVAGVSDYQGEQLDLRYATKDARDMATALQVGAHRLFSAEKVHLQQLTTDDPDATNAPTRANLLRAFKNAAQAQPTDVLVVYLAGHGVTHGGQDGDFYYLTQDARSAELTDPAVRDQVALSSRELTELIKQIPALKQVLILDTCASGRLVERLTAQRNVPTSQIRALDRMKDRTGLYVLAGCAADAVSYEASRYGQGLLTYSLLLGMRGAALRADSFVDVSRLFEYAADQVPQLARDIGGIQRPTVASPLGGSSFDIGQVTGADQAQIPLAQVKPLVLRASFQDADRWSDDLELTKRVNEALRMASSRSQGAPLVYVDALEFPDAYRLAGRYQVEDEKIEVRIKVFRGKEDAGELTVAGNTADIAQVAADILKETEQLIAGGG